MIGSDHKRLSIRRQCKLVSISRASFYRQPADETSDNLELMRIIDAAFMEMPWYGSRQMARHLRRQGWGIGSKQVRRLMHRTGLSPIYQVSERASRILGTAFTQAKQYRLCRHARYLVVGLAPD